MNLQSFVNELEGLAPGRLALRKVAATGSLFGRMGAIGAASGLGALGIGKAKAMMTGNPYDEPTDNVLGAMVKGGLGGLSIAGLLHLIGKASRKGG